MNGDPILAYHSAFDQKFLEKTLKAQLGYTVPHIWMDVAELLPAIFPKAETRGAASTTGPTSSNSKSVNGITPLPMPW